MYTSNSISSMGRFENDLFNIHGKLADGENHLETRWFVCGAGASLRP